VPGVPGLWRGPVAPCLTLTCKLVPSRRSVPIETMLAARQEDTLPKPLARKDGLVGGRVWAILEQCKSK
jgi:hypothetical protein